MLWDASQHPFIIADNIYLQIQKIRNNYTNRQSSQYERIEGNNVRFIVDESYTN